MIRIALTSDHHIGGAFALWHPDVPLSSGGLYRLNVGQEYLLENWQRIANELPPLDIIIWLGDGTDGKQAKEFGRYLVEPEPVVQARCLAELAKPYCQRLRKHRGKSYVVRSTRYHDLDDSGMEVFAGIIEAEPACSISYTHDWLLMECGGFLLDIAHAQSHMIRYRSTPLEREGQFSDMSGNRADVIIRGHAHEARWQYGEGANVAPMRLEIGVPSWQLQSAYCKRSMSPNRLLSRNLGMLVLELEQGELPRVRPYLFAHPPQRRVIVASA